MHPMGDDQVDVANAEAGEPSGSAPSPVDYPRVQFLHLSAGEIEASGIRLIPTQLRLPSAEGDAPDAVGAIDVTPVNATASVDYPLHWVTSEYAEFTPEEMEALCKSLRDRGLIVPVVIWRNQTVDGRHRTVGCRKEGVPLHFNDITDRCQTEEEMLAYVRALNEHRRANTKPLTSEQKRARTKAAIKADPTRSDRRIADEIGVSPTTAGKVRSDLEAKGDVSKMDTRTDTKGRRQPGRKKISQSKAPPDQVLDDEPTLFDPSPSLAPKTSAAKNRDAGPPEPAAAPKPEDLTREYLAQILDGAAALRRVPVDADFGRMATIIDPSERERCKKDMSMAANIARRLEIALMRFDLGRSDPPTLPAATA
jgi:ParB-like chromosome segregation protein Spo0J